MKEVATSKAWENPARNISTQAKDRLRRDRGCFRHRPQHHQVCGSKAAEHSSTCGLFAMAPCICAFAESCDRYDLYQKAGMSALICEGKHGVISELCIGCSAVPCWRHIVHVEVLQAVCRAPGTGRLRRLEAMPQGSVRPGISPAICCRFQCTSERTSVVQVSYVRLGAKLTSAGRP